MDGLLFSKDGYVEAAILIKWHVCGLATWVLMAFLAADSSLTGFQKHFRSVVDERAWFKFEHEVPFQSQGDAFPTPPYFLRLSFRFR